jgi:hypothetical protein
MCAEASRTKWPAWSVSLGLPPTLAAGESIIPPRQGSDATRDPFVDMAKRFVSTFKRRLSRLGDAERFGLHHGVNPPRTPVDSGTALTLDDARQANARIGSVFEAHDDFGSSSTLVEDAMDRGRQPSPIYAHYHVPFPRPMTIPSQLQTSAKSNQVTTEARKVAVDLTVKLPEIRDRLRKWAEEDHSDDLKWSRTPPITAMDADEFSRLFPVRHLLCFTVLSLVSYTGYTCVRQSLEEIRKFRRRS